MKSKYRIRPDQVGLAYPKKIKVKVKDGKIVEPENSMQGKAETLLEIHGINYLHLPTERIYNALQTSKCPGYEKANILLALKSFPDLMCFLPISDKYNLSWGPELKTKTGKLKKGQRNMGHAMSIPVIRDIQKFEDELQEFKRAAEKLINHILIGGF